MFGWFTTRPGLSTEQRKWADGRIEWILNQFGRERVCRCRAVVPTPEFFPDRFEGREEDVTAMFARVCSYMGVEPRRVELYYYSDDDPDLGPGFHLGGDRDRAAGLHHGGAVARIGIERSQLREPMSLVATIAHELGHVLLLDDGRVDRDEADHEPLTDLLTVFLGMGVFGANSAVHESNWRSAGWSGWKIGRLGYLSQPMWGYALAAFAQVRGETKPSWRSHLRPDIRAAVDASAKMLAREIVQQADGGRRS